MISELVVDSERKKGGVRNSNNSNSKSGELISGSGEKKELSMLLNCDRFGIWTKLTLEVTGHYITLYNCTFFTAICIGICGRDRSIELTCITV